MTARTEIHDHEDGCDHRTGGNTDEEDEWTFNYAMPLENEALRIGIGRGEKMGRMEGLEMGVESGRKVGEEMAREMGFYRGVAIALLTLSTGEEARTPVASSIINCSGDDEAAVLAEEIMEQQPIVDPSLTPGKVIHRSPRSVYKVKLATDEDSFEMRGAGGGVNRREDDVSKFFAVSERARKALRMVCQLAVSALPGGRVEEEEEVVVVLDGNADVTADLEACRRKFRAVIATLRCPLRYDNWEVGEGAHDQTLSF